MTAPATTLEPPAHSSTDEVEKLLLTGVEIGKGAAASTVADARHEVRAHDFRSAPLLSARDLQKLRLHQTEFVNGLASHLSMFLRLEFTMKLASLQTVIYRRLAETLAQPNLSHTFQGRTPWRGGHSRNRAPAGVHHRGPAHGRSRTGFGFKPRIQRNRKSHPGTGIATDHR